MADKFQIAVDKWAKKLKTDVQTFTRMTAIMVHDRIVIRTPVDTGRARASWNIVAGESPDTSVQDAAFSGGEGAGTSTAKAKQNGLAVGNSYVISNNLPYIQRLEQGSSRQAPAGMVLLAIAEVEVILENRLGGTP